MPLPVPPFEIARVVIAGSYAVDAVNAAEPNVPPVPIFRLFPSVEDERVIVLLTVNVFNAARVNVPVVEVNVKPLTEDTPGSDVMVPVPAFIAID